MSDGANLGISATRALKTIIGGEPAPTKEEGKSKEQLIADLLAIDDNYKKASTDYDSTTMWLAKQMYLERVAGKEGDADAMYQHVKTKFKDKWTDWNVDFTGFMVGFANNLSRHLLDKPEQSNPALITIDV